MTTQADEHLQDSLGRLREIVKSLMVDGEGVAFGSLAIESETQWLLGDVFLNHIYPEVRAIAGAGILGTAIISPVTFYSQLMHRSVPEYQPLQPLVLDGETLMGQGPHILPMTKVAILWGALNTPEDGRELLKLIDALNGAGYSVHQVLCLVIPSEDAADPVLQADYPIEQIISLEALEAPVETPSPIISLS